MYQSGEKAYFIESNRSIREAQIVRERNGMCLISFQEGGGIWIRSNRLYRMKKDAETAIQKQGIRRARLGEEQAWQNHLAAILG